MLRKFRLFFWFVMRQIRAKKGRNLSFMTWMSIFGSAIGVFALVVVLSVMGGFAQDLRERVFSGLPHAELLSKNPSVGFSLKEFPVSSIEDIYPGVVAAEPFTKSDVVLRHGKHIASVTLFGLDADYGGYLWGISQGLMSGSLHELDQDVHSELPGIILGEGLSAFLAVSLGDQLTVLTPDVSAADVLSGEPVSQNFIVKGIFRTSLPRYDSKFAVVSLSAGRQFLSEYDPSLDEDEYVSGIAVNLKDPENVDSLNVALRPAKFSKLGLVTWKEVNASLLMALALEKYTMTAILLLITLVAAFSVSGTMMLLVMHKRGEIALLRSLGMSQQDILRLYLTHGFGIGFLGSMIGLAAGLSVCWALYYFRFYNLPSGVYYLSKLPVRFLPMEYTAIVICSLILSIVAASYPAVLAAKQDPGVGVRCT